MKSRIEAERDVYKVALEGLLDNLGQYCTKTDNIAAVWQDGPAPKDGSWILGMFNGEPHIVHWAYLAYGGDSIGWVLAHKKLVVVSKNEPERWARIIPPNQKQPAPWEREIFEGED